MIGRGTVCVLYSGRVVVNIVMCFFVQAEDGIRDLVRSRGLGDVYKRQAEKRSGSFHFVTPAGSGRRSGGHLPADARSVLPLSLIHI